MDFFCSRQKIVANLPVTSYFIDNQRYKGCHIAFFIVLSAMPSASPCKRIRDASRYTIKKISLKFLFLSDIFLFPFIRQQVTVLA